VIVKVQFQVVEGGLRERTAYFSNCVNQPRRCPAVLQRQGVAASGF